MIWGHYLQPFMIWCKVYGVDGSGIRENRERKRKGGGWVSKGNELGFGVGVSHL